MTLKNFRAEDFHKHASKENIKLAPSKKDRVSEPVPTSKPIIAKDADPDSVPEGTVPEILAWVGEDAERAQKALDSELEHEKPRKGLVNSLVEVVDAEADESDEDADEADSDEADSDK